MIQSNSLYHADCLTLLERMDDGVARTVYLDPPWFSQPFVRTAASGSRVANGLREYLENFTRVLQQCHRILADDGNIVVHADPSLGQKLSLLLGQIFKNNHIDDYILPNFRNPQGPRHATLLHYGKGSDSVLNLVLRPVAASEKEANPDNDPRGPYRVVDLTTHLGRPSLQFEWRGILPPNGRSWRYGMTELERLAQDGRVIFPSIGRVPRLKAFVSEREGIPVGTVWDDLQPVSGRDVERVGLGSQQPVALIERLIQICSNAGDLIVDPYCGSGTSLIAAHRRARRWIGSDSFKNAVDFSRTRLMSEGLREGSEWISCSSIDLMKLEAKPIFLRRVVTMVEDLNAAEVLIDEGESEWVERKVAAYWNAFTNQKDDRNKEKLIRSVAAFLNSDNGGTLLIGVADDGTLPGLTNDYTATNSQRPGRDSYELWLRQTLSHNLGNDFGAFLRISFEEVRGRDVCVVQVAAANRAACYGERLPIRRGNQTVDLTLKEAIDYSLSRWSS